MPLSFFNYENMTLSSFQHLFYTESHQFHPAPLVEKKKQKKEKKKKNTAQSRFINF